MRWLAYLRPGDWLAIAGGAAVGRICVASAAALAVVASTDTGRDRT